MTLPAPTLAIATTDYMPAGVRRYTFVPTIAVVGAPTSVELTAGTDYTGSITAVAGFTTTAADIDNASFASDYLTTIPGQRSSASSTWTLKASKTSIDARTLLVGGTNGFVVIYPEGISAGLKCDVWPVRIKSSNVEQVAPNALALVMVEFSIPAPPVQNISIPTA